MAGSPNQYRLDFTSAANERHARLVSAVRLAGLDKLLPFVRLVFNMQERRGGQPLGWTIDRLAAEFGVSDRTVQRWQRTLAEAGLVTIAERRRERGGQQTNELAIAWETVDERSLRGAEIGVSPRGEKVSPRPEVLSPRGEELSPPYKEDPSGIPSKNSSTQITTTVSATAQHEWPVVVSEVVLCGVSQAAKAIKAHADHGGTPETIRAIVDAWRERAAGWREEHRPINLYRRLTTWRPGQDATVGWPPPVLTETPLLFGSLLRSEA